MGVTREQRYILFLFGTCISQFSKRYADKPLNVLISKSAFIELARNARLVSKKPRALYKNLQHLEQQKYITYVKQSLKLTKKGLQLYKRTLSDVQPCIRALAVLQSKIIGYTKKTKTVLRA